MKKRLRIWILPISIALWVAFLTIVPLREMALKGIGDPLARIEGIFTP